MSSSAHGANLVVEWSSKRITTLEIPSNSQREFDVTDTLPFAGRSAVLAISRRAVFVRATRLPNAAPEELRMVVQVKLAELFPVPPSDLAYDYLLLSDVNSEGRLALIMALPVLELKRAYEKMSASGIKIVKTVPSALAAAALAESVGLQDAAVVEVGSDFTSVDVVSGGVLRLSRVVPRSALIDVEVGRTYAAAGLPCDKVVAAGGQSFPEADAFTALTTVQAIANGAIDKFKINIELPEVIAARELAGRRRRSLVSAAFLVFSLAAAYYAYSARAETTALADAKIAQANKTLTANLDYQKKAQAEANKEAAITKILTGAFSPAQKLSDIATIAAYCVPTGIWLTGLSVERGKEVTIRGSAVQNDAVSTYVDNLNNYIDPASGTPRFRNAKFLFANNGEVLKTAVDQFSVTAFPIGNLPLALQQKSGVSSAQH